MRDGDREGRGEAASRRRTRLFTLAGAAAIALAALAEGTAAAQGRAARAAVDRPSAAEVGALRDKVSSEQAALVMEGLTEAKGRPLAGAAFAPPIEELLVRGTTVAIGKAAIEALGALGRPTSSAVIGPYLRHRAPELRRAAVRALAQTKGPHAVAGLREGLRGDDAMVRGYAASGLGALGATEALPELFLALDRGVTESASAIGQLCTGADCERLAGYLGKLPLDVMTSGLDPMLFRPKALPEDAQLKLVARIRDLATPEAGRYLADVLGRWPASGSAKVKAMLEGAVASIPGAKGGTP